MKIILLLAATLIGATGCNSSNPVANEAAITNERLASIDNRLSDISASLKKIADRPHIFPIGAEKEPKQ